MVIITKDTFTSSLFNLSGITPKALETDVKPMVVVFNPHLGLVYLKHTFISLLLLLIIINMDPSFCTSDQQFDKKRSWEMLCREKPDIVKDREAEKVLQRVATRYSHVCCLQALVQYSQV